MENQTKLIRVAQAEDTYDLLQHIAWTDVILPKLNHKKEALAKMLVDHLLGQELPANLTKEQVAGKIYGINEIISLFEQILTQGKKALEDIKSQGIHLQ